MPLKLKGLDQCIGVTICHPTWQRTRPNDPEDKHFGWAFVADDKTALSSPAGVGHFVAARCSPDTITGSPFVRDIYEKCQDTLGKYSVPVLYDKLTSTIVNNESADIQRMISNGCFDEWATGPYARADFYPTLRRGEIDEMNDFVAKNINSGVYACGNAKTQEAYDEVNGKCIYCFFSLFTDPTANPHYIPSFISKGC
jgi:putative glutathione S-transferase